MAQKKNHYPEMQKKKFIILKCKGKSLNLQREALAHALK
jgi:hypothetical protein